MNYPLNLAITLALTTSLAAAQSTVAPTPATAPQTAALGDVVVTGTTDLLGNFLKASLTVQPGTSVDGLNLRQIEQEVLATGYFSTAMASLNTTGGPVVLTLAVKANPVISAVNVSGLTYFPVEGYQARIADLLNIAPGATLNTERVEQSKELLAQNFRSDGYPFDPKITTQTKVDADGRVTLNYLVNETAPISRVEVEGNTRLPRDLVVGSFKPLYDAKTFTPAAYFKAAQQIAEAYQAAGFLQSGLDSSATTLEGGVLKVKLAESVVSSIDTSNLGADVGTTNLLTKMNQPLTSASLEADVRTLSNLTGKSVGFALQPDAQNPSQVTVLFGDAQAETGPITQIRFVGNTKLSSAELQAALKLKVSDVYSKQLAESSFFALREAYRVKGYDISTRNPIDFDKGVLTYTLHEASLAKFELKWDGAHNTKDRVILRELQDLSGVVTDASIRDGLDRITRLGLVKVTNLVTRSDDPKNPEALTYVISVTEQNGSQFFSPSLAYDTATGFSGNLSVNFNNLMGLGHVLETGVTAQPTDSGQFLGGGVTYTIPWIDTDFADFRKTRTSLSLSLSSNLSPNNIILNEDSSVTGRQFTQRSSGFSVRVGRSLGQYLTGSLGVGTSYEVNYLEKITAAEQKAVDEQAADADPKLPPLLDDATATKLLPESGIVTRFSPAIAYDSTNADFATQGIRANFSPSYNFGSSGSTSLSWFKLEGGASTYFGLGKTLEKGFNQQSKQQVFAVRANAGTLLGTYLGGSNFSIGDASTLSAYELRGVPAGTLKGSTYLTGSAEYRYDFGVSNSIAQGLYGIAFVDAGTAWGLDNKQTSAYGLGLGVQLNLGIGGATLPALRFDYGFSPSNQSSKFSFRIGSVW